MDGKINSLSSYMEWVQSQRELLDSLDMGTNKEYELFFRGVSNQDYHDIPSIFRHYLFENEHIIFNECLSRNYHDFANDSTTFDILVRMQHYGIPTRLLDITCDPLVALFFATRQSKHMDGARKEIPGKVFSYFIHRGKIFYPDDPEVSILANLSRMKFTPSSSSDSMRELQKRVEREATIIKKIDEDDIRRIYCVKPRMNNPRIILQKGAFLLFGQISPDSKQNIPLIFELDQVLEIETLWELIKSFSFEKSQHTTSVNANQLIEKIKPVMPAIEKCATRFLKKIVRNPNFINRGDSFEIFKKDIIRTLNKEIDLLLYDTDFMEFLAMNMLSSSPEHQSRYYEEWDCQSEFSAAVTKYAVMKDIVADRGFIAKKSQIVYDKEKILEELENYGINKASLFPELNILGDSLRKKYGYGVN